MDGLQRLGKRKDKSAILGINIGINKDTQTPVEDYLECLTRARNIADYVTVNVSSPNTPGLRSFQQVEKLQELLNTLITASWKNNDPNRQSPYF